MKLVSNSIEHAVHGPCYLLDLLINANIYSVRNVIYDIRSDNTPRNYEKVLGSSYNMIELLLVPT